MSIKIAQRFLICLSFSGNIRKKKIYFFLYIQNIDSIKPCLRLGQYFMCSSLTISILRGMSEICQMVSILFALLPCYNTSFDDFKTVCRLKEAHLNLHTLVKTLLTHQGVPSAPFTPQLLEMLLDKLINNSVVCVQKNIHTIHRHIDVPRNLNLSIQKRKLSHFF